jgi:small subunit ribosomal protein S2
MAEDGSFEKLIKKEVLSLTREQTKLEQSLGGIKDMQGLPDALFVVDVGYEDIAVKEARKLGIPIIGIVDTNNDPDGTDYMIPGNDDAIRAIQLYVRAAADAVLEGRASVPQPESTDEFVELDADGNPVAKSDSKPSKKPAARKKTAAKKTVSKAAAKPAAAADKAPEAEAEPVAAEKVEAKPADTESAAKAEAEPVATDTAEATEAPVTKAVAKPAKKKAAKKKAAAKKTAAKKTAAKKKTAKKTVAKKKVAKKAAKPAE